jgi:putative ABC transport system substrate-binding protein
VEIIVGHGTAASLAAKKATSTIPIVIHRSGDPVATGLVKSLSRPGGNITGLALNSAALGAKRFELLREILPRASRVAYLVDPMVPATSVLARVSQEATAALAFELDWAKASSPEELDRTLAAMAARRPDGLVVSGAIVFWTHRQRILRHCARHRLPAIYAYSEPVREGGLASYAGNLVETFANAAAYVARILRGAQPADLPVEQPTRFELVLNVKAAETLGLKLPDTLLARADEVIR